MEGFQLAAIHPAGYRTYQACVIVEYVRVNRLYFVLLHTKYILYIYRDRCCGQVAECVQSICKNSTFLLRMTQNHIRLDKTVYNPIMIDKNLEAHSMFVSRDYCSDWSTRKTFEAANQG